MVATLLSLFSLSRCEGLVVVGGSISISHPLPLSRDGEPYESYSLLITPFITLKKQITLFHPKLHMPCSSHGRPAPPSPPPTGELALARLPARACVPSSARACAGYGSRGQRRIRRLFLSPHLCDSLCILP